MLRQYNPQRHRIANIYNQPRAVGTVELGTIARIAGDTVIVLAWLPREIGAAACVNGRYENRFMARGGHLAAVRSLRNGRRYYLADHHLIDRE